MADFLGMMKQAAQLQSKMKEMQDELGNVEVEGISGGGLVSVRMTAKMEVKAVKIDPSLMKPDEREIVEDLLVTGHRGHPPVGIGDVATAQQPIDLHPDGRPAPVEPVMMGRTVDVVVEAHVQLGGHLLGDAALWTGAQVGQ